MSVNPEDVELRLASLSDIDRFESEFGTRSGATTNQWFGLTPLTTARDLVRDVGGIGIDQSVVSLTLGGELVGRVDWFSKAWGRAATSKCWEIGVGIFAEFRGRGVGTVAHRRIVDYLFNNTPIHRIQATTDPSNDAELHCLRSAGFQYEGTVREGQWREGEWRDQCLFSILRDEWSPEG